MNIAIEYMYRDPANFKTYETAILENPENLSIEDIELSTKLDEFNWFYPEECGLVPIDYADEIGIGFSLYHEMVELSATTELSNYQDFTVSDFILRYKGYN